MRGKIPAIAGLAAGVMILATAAWAQEAHSVWDGVYTDAQAARGATAYMQHCAVCHGLRLEGKNESPPLTGQFMPDWAGTTLVDLFDKISATMPLNRPGSLDPAANADILAYVLKVNGIPAGATELGSDADSLKAIRFDILPPAKTKTRPAAR